MGELALKFDAILAHVKQLESDGKYLHAVQLLEPAIEHPEAPGKFYFRLASNYIKLGYPEAAADSLKRLFMFDPNDTDTIVEIAEFFITRSLWEQAVEFLALADPEEVPSAVFYMGYAYFQLKDFEHALLCFNTALKALSHQSDLFPFTQTFVVKTAIRLNQVDYALNSAEHFTFIPIDMKHLLLAVCYSKKDMPVTAWENIQLAYKLNPENDEILEWSETIALQNDRPDDAIEYCRIALQILPHPRLVHYINLGKACLKSGKPGIALNVARAGLRLDPKNELLNQIVKTVSLNAS